MVAPLDIDIALLLQLVYHQMRAVAAVEYIADDVQLIDDRVLHKVAQRNDELVGSAYVYDRVYDLAVIFLFVEVLAAGGHKNLALRSIHHLDGFVDALDILHWTEGRLNLYRVSQDAKIVPGGNFTGSQDIF